MGMYPGSADAAACARRGKPNILGFIMGNRPFFPVSFSIPANPPCYKKIAFTGNGFLIYDECRRHFALQEAHAQNSFSHGTASAARLLQAGAPSSIQVRPPPDA